MINRAQLKFEAKGLLKQAQVSPYLFTLVVLAIGVILEMVDTIVGGGTIATVESYVQSFQEYYPEFADINLTFPHIFPVIEVSTIVGIFVSIMVFLVQVVINGGWIFYHLGIRRGETMGYDTVLEGFSYVGKLIGLEIVILVKVFLWSLIPLAGWVLGIIAQFRYGFAIYNLCENPDIGIMEAIEMSKVQTYGYKWALFVLELSFLGWDFLCLLTLGILCIWVNPYKEQTTIGYFEKIKQIKHIGYGEGTLPPKDPFGPTQG